MVFESVVYRLLDGFLVPTTERLKFSIDCYGNIWDTMGYGECGAGGVVTTKPTGQTKDGSVWHYGGREQQPYCEDCRLTPVEGWHKKEGEGFLCKSCFGKRGGVKS